MTEINGSYPNKSLLILFWNYLGELCTQKSMESIVLRKTIKKKRRFFGERNAHNLLILQKHGGHLPTRPKRKQNQVNYNESVENSVQDSEDEDSCVATTDDMTSLKKDQINWDEETYEREEVELDMEEDDLDRK